MENESSWTVYTLRESLLQRMDAIMTLLDERYQAQNRAGDAAFAAQQTAMATAFQVADKAVQAALAAAKEATEKAEMAYDKRFEAVNEFRGQLADQAATLISRVEYGAKHDALIDKIDDVAERVVQLELHLTSRLDLAKGGDVESRQLAGDRRLTSAALAQWVGMALVGIGVIASIVLALVIHH